MMLDKLGYEGFTRSPFNPHITLVPTDDLPKIKAIFYEHFGPELGKEKFVQFFTAFVESLNETIKEEKNPIIFTELVSAYCEDYAPYEQVVVAKFRAPVIEKTVQKLLDEVEEFLKKRPAIKLNPGLHLTLAVRLREPSKDLGDATVEEILNATGPFKTDLDSYWKAFQ